MGAALVLTRDPVLRTIVPIDVVAKPEYHAGRKYLPTVFEITCPSGEIFIDLPKMVVGYIKLCYVPRPARNVTPVPG
jgi:hypothetical protein